MARKASIEEVIAACIVTMAQAEPDSASQGVARAMHEYIWLAPKDDHRSIIRNEF